jgi:hypothetical protein
MSKRFSYVLVPVLLLSSACLQTYHSPVSLMGLVDTGYVFAPTDPDPLRFRQIACVDTAGEEITAFLLMVPEGWHFTGGIDWHPEKPGIPAGISFSVTKPQNRASFNAFPDLSFVWSSNLEWIRRHPKGSHFEGKEVGPVVSARQAFRKYVLPRYRNGAAGLKVLREEPLPQLIKQMADNLPAQEKKLFHFDAVKVRFAYTDMGIPMEEVLYILVESQSMAEKSWGVVNYNTDWKIDYILSFRATYHHLDAETPLFSAMVHSLSLNPIWVSEYKDLITQIGNGNLKPVRNPHDLHERVKHLEESEMYDTVLVMGKDQAVYDWIAADFTDFNPTLDLYNDPDDGQRVYFPAGFYRAWNDSSVNFILSRDSLYNPNTVFSQPWHPLIKP